MGSGGDGNSQEHRGTLDSASVHVTYGIEVW